ncbi:MAG: hypothetical protein FD174_738 [Geobacteraceae bacterium]|nr:MAG: hypothetical protein FD174_738 [Geobacteraceae bacterium]
MKGGGSRDVLIYLSIERIRNINNSVPLAIKSYMPTSNNIYRHLLLDTNPGR